MYWNYRVVRKTDEESGETLLGIHEVHYRDDKPVMVTVNPAVAVDETHEGLVRVLEMMAKAPTLPILDYDQIGE